MHVGIVAAATSIFGAFVVWNTFRGFTFAAVYIRAVVSIAQSSGVFMAMMVYFSFGFGWGFMILFAE